MINDLTARGIFEPRVVGKGSRWPFKKRLHGGPQLMKEAHTSHERKSQLKSINDDLFVLLKPTTTTIGMISGISSGVGTSLSASMGGSGGSGSGGSGGGGGGYSLHQLQGNKQHGSSRSGFLLKKSEGKVRKVWQKRRCEVRGDGFLSIYHADETKPPTRVNLLTCQIKPVAEDRRCFDLISCKCRSFTPFCCRAHSLCLLFCLDNRTYHFQVEEEEELAAWTSVLVNSKEVQKVAKIGMCPTKLMKCEQGALMRAFDDNGRHGPKVNRGFLELQQAIIRYVLRLPGNDRCADCCSQNGKKKDVFHSRLSV